MRPTQRSAVALTTLLLAAASVTVFTAPANAAASTATPQSVSARALTVATSTSDRDAAISKAAATWNLGAPLGPVVGGLKDGGAYRQFQRGFIVWSPATGAQVSKGGIRTAYWKLGFEKGRLGYPTSGEMVHGTTGNLFYSQNYQGGIITWNPMNGGHAIVGAIHDRWKLTGREDGKLPFAWSDEFTGLKDGGAGQAFAGGTIYWSPKTGAHSLVDSFSGLYDSLGLEKGRLGYPTTEKYAVAAGAEAQDFQNGSILITSKHASILTGGIADKYFSVGGYKSALGLPADVTEKAGLVRGGVSQSFERGAIVWSPNNGAHVSKGAIRAAWLKNGAQDGKLGYPITDEIASAGGAVRQYFEKGFIVWTATGGAIVTEVPPHAIN